MTKSLPQTLTLSTFAICSMILGIAHAQQDFSNVDIKTTQLSDGLYMLQGAGGNIGVSAGEDGVFMIDDQFAPLSGKILTAIADITDKPVTYVLNTHWHGDHTGGNENIGNAGAVIVSHENVRKRLSTKQFMKAFGREVPAAPETALPVITFTENATFHFNDTEIRVMHLPNAHTDGDSVVFFSDANVLHMGDTFFNGFYPFIDQSSGGSLDGLIDATTHALTLVNDDSTIIPGHGGLAKRTDLESYLEMLTSVKSIMQPLVASGKSRNDVISSNPLAELSDKWGNGFMKPDTFTGIIYDIESAK